RRYLHDCRGKRFGTPALGGCRSVIYAVCRGEYGQPAVSHVSGALCDLRLDDDGTVCSLCCYLYSRSGAFWFCSRCTGAQTRFIGSHWLRWCGDTVVCCIQYRNNRVIRRAYLVGYRTRLGDRGWNCSDGRSLAEPRPLAWFNSGYDIIGTRRRRWSYLYRRSHNTRCRCYDNAIHFDGWGTGSQCCSRLWTAYAPAFHTTTLASHPPISAQPDVLELQYSRYYRVSWLGSPGDFSCATSLYGRVRPYRFRYSHQRTDY